MPLSEEAERYIIYENRLASFQGPQPVAKRRASNANSRAPKALSWPHKSLPPADLAQAGFYFSPQPSNPDNVVCFLCNKSLDGWEDGDNALEEHVKHSPNCGWAITAAIEAGMGDFEKAHPLDPFLVEARKATFAGMWPYESKKGWKCKTKQLAEAGWKYTPSLESDDMATCVYCQLALDGWESGDKPLDEHVKRSPDCPFFLLLDQAAAPPKKAGRSKAARSSKASRLSVQSIATISSEAPSAGDITADHDDSVLTTTSVMAGGAKKGTKAKKAAAAKPRKTRAKKEEAIEILEDDPLVEQAPPPAPPKATRGKKRTSADLEDSALTATTDAPPPKKRATRAKGSNAVDSSVLTVASQDLDMADAPAAAKPAAGRKKGRTSAAKTTRKASASSLRSTASTASLRGRQVPDDDELDRQLQADLERPLSDDEDILADSDSERKKAPAPAKGRPRKNTAKSQPPSAEDYAMFDPTPAQSDDAVIEAELKALEAEVRAEQEQQELQVPKKGRKAGPRKASKQTKKAKEPEPPVEEPVAAPEPIQQDEEPENHDASILSTGTVITKDTSSRASTSKPSKKSAESHSAAEPSKQAPAAKPAERSVAAPLVEVEIETASVRESFSAFKRTPGKVVSHTPTGPTPARDQKALPPPPQSSSRHLQQPPATPRAHHRSPGPAPSAKQATLSPSQSPQSSDAENQPPSSKPAASAVAKRVALAPVAATPMRGSPSKRHVVAGLQSTTPWKPVDLDAVFSSPGGAGGAGKENGVDRLLREGGDLASPERQMTVEEWIYHNAGQAEQKLRQECEAMVSAFEREGSKAMQVLEGLVAE